MKIVVEAVEFAVIAPWRDLYTRELDCQIVHHTAFDRPGCFQAYALRRDDEQVAYGAVWTGPYWMQTGSVFEFYVAPAHRCGMYGLFEAFVTAVGPPQIYAQTNDPFLGVLIYSFTETTTARHILFADHQTTHHAVAGAVVRRLAEAEKPGVFAHRVEPVGDWVVEFEERIVATGGLGFHYNLPYGDIFMEVDEPFRQRGIGALLVQELKRICHAAGRVPCARTTDRNISSRRTLERAGFAPCGRLLVGDRTAALKA